jgi:hypothetical protein
MRRSTHGELLYSDNENSYFELEIETSDVEGIKLCDDITLNKMRGNDINSKKAANNPNEIYRIEEESIITGNDDTPIIENGAIVKLQDFPIETY